MRLIDSTCRRMMRSDSHKVDAKLLAALQDALEPTTRTPMRGINDTLAAFECQHLQKSSPWKDRAFLLAKVTFLCALGLRLLTHAALGWQNAPGHDDTWSGDTEDADRRLLHVSKVVENATLLGISYVIMFKFDMTHTLVFGTYRSQPLLTVMDRYFVAILAFVVLFSSTRSAGKQLGIPSLSTNVLSVVLYLSVVLLPFLENQG